MSILFDLYQKYGKEVIVSSEDLMKLIMPNRRKMEKMRITLVGGSEKYPGALIMSALAALKCGVHGVVMIAPEEVCRNAVIISPSGLVILKMNNKLSIYRTIKNFTQKWQLIALIGPGMEDNAPNRSIIKKLISLFIKYKIPILVDANALDIVFEERLVDKLKNQKVVLTPNDKELKLIGRYYNLIIPENFLDKVEMVKSLALKLGLTICAKGRRDIITDGKRLKINYSGDAIMSAANCGDVLSGLIVSFMAETDDLFDACVAGTFLAGRAGNLSFSKKGYSFVAYDLLESISEFIKMASVQTLIDEVRISKYHTKKEDLEL